MPTIKTKKEMNLSELTEWAIKKDIKDEKFYSKNGCHISIDFRGHVFLWDIRLNEIFTVEIEEEITEDMKLFLISRCIGKLGNVSYLYDITTIKRRLKNLPEDCEITHFYIENENKELVLIWTKEKGLV
ncbi:hypothetical protein MUA23_05465 [Mammaliicoccus sciuri]|uniref:hypothetical protein n=1 Tax=Mammaliicoccus sciuri TaxID=1296 RepID=UPI0021CFFE7B|nr:hypothetical protein [Mammaliicoccus sciuri]UXU72925.1 hypothetical protein MUA23_05465 [Mammaliicoccus sciuri]